MWSICGLLHFQLTVDHGLAGACCAHRELPVYYIHSCTYLISIHPLCAVHVSPKRVTLHTCIVNCTQCRDHFAHKESCHILKAVEEMGKKKTVLNKSRNTTPCFAILIAQMQCLLVWLTMRPCTILSAGARLIHQWSLIILTLRWKFQ